jgi:hypothetical protein
MIDPEIVEILADGEHEQWLELMNYLSRLHSKDMSFHEYTAACMKRKLFRPYSALTEEQKESDRKFALKTIDDLNEAGYVIVKADQVKSHL